MNWFQWCEGRAPDSALAATLVLLATLVYMLLTREAINRHRGADIGLCIAALAVLVSWIPLPLPIDGWRTGSLGAGVEIALEETTRSIPWVGVCFSLGAFAFALRTLMSIQILSRLARRGQAPTDWVMASVAAGAPPGTVCVVSSEVERPICFGVWSPCIVLPRTLVESSSQAAITSVLQHEFAHLQLRHPAARMRTALAGILLFWNPLYWWVAKLQRANGERLADDMAAHRVGKRPYVESIVDLAHDYASGNRIERQPAFALEALGGQWTSLETRMRDVIDRERPLATNSRGWHRGLRAFAAIALLAGVAIAASPRPLADGANDTSFLRFSDVSPEQLGLYLVKFSTHGHRVHSVELVPGESPGHHDALVEIDRRMIEQSERKPSDRFVKIFSKPGAAE